MQGSRQRSWPAAGRGLSVLMTTILLGIGFTLASCETAPKNRFEYKKDGTPKKKRKYPTPAADCASAPVGQEGGVFAFRFRIDFPAFVGSANASDRRDEIASTDDGHVILAGGGGDGGEGFNPCAGF